jgi:hypothetical protein
VAADGQQGSHSPLVLGLLDRQSGIFAPGVSLEQGIKNACKAVEELSGVHIRQSPTDMKLYHVRDFFLKPAAANFSVNMRQNPAVSNLHHFGDFTLKPTVSPRVRPQEVNEGAGSADTPTSQYVQTNVARQTP